MLEGVDADYFAISIDSPEQHKALKEAGDLTFSFLSDPDLEVIDYVNMKNDQMSYRGYSILDKDGNYVSHQINDLWGEQIDVMINNIKEELAE